MRTNILIFKLCCLRIAPPEESPEHMIWILIHLWKVGYLFRNMTYMDYVSRNECKNINVQITPTNQLILRL